MPTTTIRYDERTRDKVAPILDSIGLSLNAYLNLALRQLTIQGRVPFALYGERTSPAAARLIPGASPRAKKVDGKLVFPANWAEDDDE